MSAIEGRRSTGNVGVILEDAEDEAAFVCGAVVDKETASVTMTSCEAAVFETGTCSSRCKQSIGITAYKI